MSDQSNQSSDPLLKPYSAKLDTLITPDHNALLSDHFDGATFHNPTSAKAQGLSSVFTWLRTRKPAPWPTWQANELFPLPSACHSESANNWSVTFINHATVLLQIGQVNFITDPVFSTRCSPLKRLGPRRVRAPGISLEQLPPIHVVLLSHNHYDHMDICTLKFLAERDNPMIVTGLGNATYLKRNHISNVIELDWWESTDFAGHRVHYVPAQHFSGRGLRDRDKSLWGGLVVDTPFGKALFAGDTGYGPHFKDIYQRFGSMRLALLPIGAYEPRWFMKAMHMNPNDAVLAHKDLAAQQSVAMHFNTFQLTDEPIDQPVLDLNAALTQHGLTQSDFMVLKEGQSFVVP